jgi:hypothetical protein
MAALTDYSATSFDEYFFIGVEPEVRKSRLTKYGGSIAEFETGVANEKTTCPTFSFGNHGADR